MKTTFDDRTIQNTFLQHVEDHLDFASFCDEVVKVDRLTKFSSSTVTKGRPFQYVDRSGMASPLMFTPVDDVPMGSVSARLTLPDERLLDALTVLPVAEMIQDQIKTKFDRMAPGRRIFVHMGLVGKFWRELDMQSNNASLVLSCAMLVEQYRNFYMVPVKYEF